MGERSPSPVPDFEPTDVQKWILRKASPDFVQQLVSHIKEQYRPTTEEQQQEQEQQPPPDSVNRSGGKLLQQCPSQQQPPRRQESISGCSSTANFYLDDAMPPSYCNKRTSITSEIYNTWIACSPSRSPTAKSNGGTSGLTSARCSGEWKRQIELLDEGELFMELIRDVSNELDIDVLCHKILVNVGLLTKADRGSLFLADGSSDDNRYLVAKLFDVTVDTKLEDAMQKVKSEEIRIPFGVGVAGIVAQTKQIVNINEAYEDPRFNSDIDIRTGYKTHSILCVPICNYEGEVIGVAQIINKTDGTNAFTDRDIQVFQRYLTFCGIGIQNAQLFEMSIQEFKRNQMLLNLARNIFEEQNNLKCLVTKIMNQARDLLKCERCAVFLLDLDCGESFHLKKIEECPKKPIRQVDLVSKKRDSIVNIEEILTYGKEEIYFPTVFELRSDSEHYYMNETTSYQCKNSPLIQIAKYVAATGQIVNIDNVTSWISREEDSIFTKCVLCMPILNGQKNLIGVAQLINKETGQPFNDNDISIFEAFAIFCGLGIHNTQMYENACKLMAKQKVALECLSYHATASYDDTQRLTQDSIPTAEMYNLYSFKFIDFQLTDDDTCRAAIRMFLECNLVQKFQIPYQVLCRWLLSVKKNYRPVKYHNWRHALNVAQTMFAMLKTGKMERFMTDLEILGLLVACLCHDLDHRGTNNAFQSKTESPLAILYTTSTMEHHHFDQCVMILNSEGNNIFQALSPDDYRRVMKLLENCILSTDLAMYFKKKNRFMELVEEGEFDWQSEEKKELLCGILMTACDVSAIAKPWEVQHKIAKLVADEFFDQGDLEKLKLNEQPVAMMDREKKDELPKMQVSFIDVICLPLYKVLSETFPWIQPLYDGTIENRKHWQELAENVEMGLTWIDHDVIEKPVEEFSVNNGRKDIEFTLTTLNCSSAQDRRYPEKGFMSLDVHTTSTSSIDSIVQGNGSTPGGGGGGTLPKLTPFTSFRRRRSYRLNRMKFHRSFYDQYHKTNPIPVEEGSIKSDSFKSTTTIASKVESSASINNNKTEARVPTSSVDERLALSSPSYKNKTKSCAIM